MPNGLGYGRGFGFRGGSPPWPYVGRGRGGLPRCAYPGTFAAPPYYHGGTCSPPYYGWQPSYGAAAYAPPVSREEELEFLKEEANSIKARLDGIEARIKDLAGEQE
ncbi:rRNA methyltransferase [Chloroflexota bacterium]